MSNLHHFRPSTAALALGVCFLSPSAYAQDKASNPGIQAAQNRTVQEEDVREAAFLFLFGVGTGPDPDYSFYCLSVDSSGLEGHDPSESLMKRFPIMHRTLRKFSECEVLKNPKDKLFGAIHDKKTGKSAWIVSLGPIQWVNDHEARAAGERYCGGLCGWWSTLRVTLENGKWKATVAPGASVMVS